MGCGRSIAVVMAAVLGAISAVDAQVTRVATFEGIAAGTSYVSSFTDPLSGIKFRDSTFPGFVVNYDPGYFGGGNYLTAGGSGGGALGALFGFTADLPAPADRVSVQALYELSPGSQLVLQGYDSHGTLVAQQSGPSVSSPPYYTLEIASGRYDIVTFKVVAGDGFAGYDNVSYTVLPEPVGVGSVVGAGVLLCGRRGTRLARGAATKG